MKKGKWISVTPTDCMTLLPVYQCSKCKYLESGYLTTEVCTNCGSINTVDKTKDIEISILSNYFEQADK